jgi:hypothetical protein
MKDGNPWCDRFCARLSAAIAKQSVPGLATWDRLLEFVEDAEYECAMEVARIDDGGGDRERAGRLGLGVVHSWGRARAAYLLTGNAARAA